MKGTRIVITLVVAILFIFTSIAATTNVTGQNEESTHSPSEITNVGTIESTVAGLFPNIGTVWINDTTFSHKNQAQIQQSFANDFANGRATSFIFYHDLKTRSSVFKEFKSVLKAKGMSLPALPVHVTNVSQKKYTVDNTLENSPTVVVSLNPMGMYFINESAGNDNGLVWAMHTIQNNINQHIQQNKIMVSNVVQSGKLVTNSMTYNGFNFLETMGWYNSNAKAPNGVTVLSLSAKIDFYSTTASTSSGTYYFLLERGTSSAIGYYDSYPWYDYWILHDVPFQYEYFKAGSFVSTVNWETSSFPGQELFSWGPHNSGSNAVVTYNVGASLSGTGLSASASISYGVQGGVVYSWADKTNPSTGIYQSDNSVGSSASSGTTYTVEPASVGDLNPTLSGGFPPFIITASFSATTQSSGIPIYPSQYSTSIGSPFNGNNQIAIYP